MSSRERIKRYCILIPGVFFVGFGIACITKAGLGSTPISAIPYTVSLIFPVLTFGTYTALYNILLIVLQLPFNSWRMKPQDMLMQLILSVVLGRFIDLSTAILAVFSPHVYVMQIVMLLCGCLAMALGIYVQLLSGVSMTPGEGFTSAISSYFKKDYGSIRIVSDMIMALVAAGICFAVYHKFLSAREGTIIVAFIVGNIVKVYAGIFQKKAEGLIEKYIED